ncbi:hypothetical protein HDU93_003045 [Gonapodya sp. JEL0774]|nr:hypothetical protein HDU93_003045 [Gonapodya sp. JEL0774]
MFQCSYDRRKITPGPPKGWLDLISNRLLDLAQRVCPDVDFFSGGDAKTLGRRKTRSLRERLEKALDCLEDFVHDKFAAVQVELPPPINDITALLPTTNFHLSSVDASNVQGTGQQGVLESTVSTDRVERLVAQAIAEIPEVQSVWSPSTFHCVSHTNAVLPTSSVFPPSFHRTFTETSETVLSTVSTLPVEVSIFDDLPELPSDGLLFYLLQKFYVRSHKYRHYYPSNPCSHRPTLLGSLNHQNPFLLLNMLAIGSLEPPDTNCQFSAAQLTSAGSALFQRSKRMLLPSTESTILHHSTIEALVLFAMYSNIHDHDFVYMTVGMAVLKARSSGLFVDPNLDLTHSWDWREAEERRRVGWATISVDIMAGLLVSRTPFVDVKEIQLGPLMR